MVIMRIASKSCHIVKYATLLTRPSFTEFQLAMRPLIYIKGFYKKQPTNCVSASQTSLKDITAIPCYEDPPKENPQPDRYTKTTVTITINCLFFCHRQ